MCAKWNTSDEQNIADRNKTNRSHQSMPYRKGRKSHYQLKDDFRLAHDCEPNRVEIFKIDRCKELPDGNEQWVDDESRSQYVREDDLAIDSFTRYRETRRTWYGTGEGSSSTDYQQQINNIENTLRIEVEELRTEARRRDSEMDDMRRELEQLRKRECKELPDATEHWVDDESRSRYERMIQLSATLLDSESGSTPISTELSLQLWGRTNLVTFAAEVVGRHVAHGMGHEKG
ncbi:hypothetical protein Taro_009202 [Colocasia esculenta]|uniref:Uncharacterized protein n=1 Tax=Colocasia esculenta TaxID=4460 RepID=A0A843TVQ6_COLES|nr:hypothetical protein [Colocasia esculenta]